MEFLSGPYRLVEALGEGGFGVVYRAEQSAPVRREVALKVIKPGMDTRRVIARFEAERQALAMMDHPHVAQVFDAGSTGSGRPYFVMELVRGAPITTHCDEQRLSTRARLALFLDVCRAVQHAHQKGIIHRDLKPSNVLVVAPEPGAPAVPKVIDFGIAKATGERLTDRTLTEAPQFLGTPAYMSPEQAAPTAEGVDTRSDVYSLGVLLYELLTGATPFDRAALREADYAELQRLICQVDPPTPSSKCTTLGDATRSAAEERGTDPPSLRRALRGDLDWIVMRCLEKEPARRYATVLELEADIERHLRDEPVLAGPPTTRYRLQKFVKRHRAQVIAGGVVAGALVLGFVGTTWGLLWALSERDRADGQATRATRAAESAERELARAVEIKRLIKQMFRTVHPLEAAGADKTLLKGILDDASKRLAAGEVTDELVAAELHHLVGDVYTNLGQYPEAERHLSTAVEVRARVLGEEHLETVDSRGQLANLYFKQDRILEAEPLLVETLEVRRRVLGPEHPNTLALAACLATVHARQERFDEAEELHRETLEARRRVLGDEDLDTTLSQHSLAALYMYRGRIAEAEALLRECLETRRRILGEANPLTLTVMGYMADLYTFEGRYADAERLHGDALEAARRELGSDHPDTLRLMNNLGRLHLRQGRFDEALPLYVEVVESRRRVLPEGHPDMLESANLLALVHRKLGRHDEALVVQLEVFDLQMAAAERPSATAYMLNVAARLLLTIDVAERRDPARARRFAQRACAMEEAKGGANLTAYLDTLALAEHQTGDTASAVRTLRRILSLMPADDVHRAEVGQRLAEFEAALRERTESRGGDG